MSHQPFLAITGGITGRDHLHARRDGQDGSSRVTTEHLTAAIVTDGCSSAPHSEVGARLGAAWLAASIANHFTPSANPRAAANEVTTNLLERIRSALPTPTPTDSLATFFLFGFLAAVITETDAIVFGIGDGLVWIDGHRTVLDPGPDNAPPYPAYALLDHPPPIAPSILHHTPTSAIQTLAIATDGAAAIPPTDLTTLVTDPKLFTNPSLLRKRLHVLADRGLLWDDTTLGIVRRAS